VRHKSYNAHGSETAHEKVWATNSMKVGEDRAKMQPSDCDKTHVNAVCATQDNKFVFTTDDYGLVNIMHWPNPDIKDSASYCGHSEHVMKVMLTPDHQKLFTVGGQDKTLIQWKVKGLPVMEPQQLLAPKPEEPKEEKPDDKPWHKPEETAAEKVEEKVEAKAEANADAPAEEPAVEEKKE